MPIQCIGTYSNTVLLFSSRSKIITSVIEVSLLIQVDEDQMNTILDFIESGKKQGAELLAGGAREGDKGYFVQPTVFGNVTDDMRIAKEEVLAV